MPDQPSPKPTNKVTASTLGAALAALVGALFHLDSAVTVPLVVVLTFLAGYVVKD